MPKETTLTIRMDKPLKDWFEVHARSLGKTMGTMARDLIEAERARVLRKGKES